VPKDSVLGLKMPFQNVFIKIKHSNCFMANETDDKVLKRFNAHFGESRPLS